MASPAHSNAQYTAENFVESAGTILFNRSTREICLIHYLKKNQWLLPKGRRNIGESRQAAALRETEEETGFKCELPPVTMITRCPPAVESGQPTARSRTHSNVCEPFMVTHRMLRDNSLKMIWWYVAALSEGLEQGQGEDKFETCWYQFDKALKTLTFDSDRDVAREAIHIFRTSFDGE